MFSEIGYGQATVRDLIRASGLATGTFYNYFPDKESVLRALVDRSAVELRAQLTESRAQAATAEEFIRGGFRVFFDYLTSDPTFFALLSRNAGAVRQLIDEPILGSAIGELSEDLEAAVKRGEMPAFDPTLMSAAMAGAALEIAVAVLERNAATPGEAAEFAASLFLRGFEGLSAT